MSAPAFAELEPMLAGEAKRPFSSPDWAFEVKYDGYRALAEWDATGARLKSRRGVDMTTWFEEVVLALTSVGGARCVVDGEICVVNEEGVAGDAEFKRLFSRSARRGYKPGDDLVTYVVFDILIAADANVMEQPLRERRALLEEVLEDVPQVRVVDQMAQHGAPMYQAALQLGLEGIVAKRLDAPYRPGVRSRDWLKVKRPSAVTAER
jgi:bifunctional non-homologous end joining protein LigD